MQLQLKRRFQRAEKGKESERVREGKRETILCFHPSLLLTCVNSDMSAGMASWKKSERELQKVIQLTNPNEISP
jgi:hypothetical protein